MTDTTRYVWAVRVSDNGGDEPRDLLPLEFEQESETGAYVEVQFWPPANGYIKHYLSRSGAVGRRDMWRTNGVTSEITRSVPVSWPNLQSPGVEERVAARLWQVRPLTSENGQSHQTQEQAMSYPYPCAACSNGNHERHNPSEGTKPGLIGGTTCPCRGNCAEWTRNPIQDLIERSSLGTPEAKAIRASVPQEQVDKIMARVRELEAEPESCVYCSHPVDDHGTTEIGCSRCGCGHDPDFHPDPPRGDE
jgi:hypothetical protein